jgi:hypothetical protein
MRYLKTMLMLAWTAAALPGAAPPGAYAANRHIAPRSLFGNAIHVIDRDAGEKTLSSIRRLVGGTNGEIDVIPFNYAENSETAFPEDALFRDEENRLLNLYREHLDRVEALPFFFTVDRDGNVDRLQTWLRLHFPERPFVIVPCWDDALRHPVLEKRYLRTQHWDAFASLLERAEVKKINYIGDEAVNRIARYLLDERDPMNRGERISTLDLVSMYSPLDPRQEALLLEQNRHPYLSRRKRLEASLMREIVKKDDENALAALVFHHPSRVSEILEQIEENRDLVSMETLEGMIRKLPEGHPSLDALFVFYCRNARDLKKRYAHSEIRPLTIIHHLENSRRGDLLESLLEKGFENWTSVFKPGEHPANQLGMISALNRTHPLTGAAVLREIALENFEHAERLFEALFFENPEAAERFMDASLKIRPELAPLAPALRSRNLFGVNRINLLLNAHAGHPFLSEAEYLSRLEELFCGNTLPALIADAEETPAWNHWLKILAAFPGIFEGIERFTPLVPHEYRRNIHSYIVSEDHNEYLARFSELAKRLKTASPAGPASSNLPEILVMGLLVPGAHKTEMCGLLEQALDSSVSLDAPCFDKPEAAGNVRTALRVLPPAILRLRGEDGLVPLLAEILDWPETAGYGLNVLKIASVLLSPSFREYRAAFERLVNGFLRHADSKKSRKRFLKVVESFSLLAQTAIDSGAEADLDAEIESAVRDYETLLSKGRRPVSFSRHLDAFLKRRFVEIFKDHWNLALDPELAPELLLSRLERVKSFFIYVRRWMDALSGPDDRDYLPFMEIIRLLERPVRHYLNTGHDNVKDLKYGGTLETRRQTSLVRALLLQKGMDTLRVRWHLDNFTRDYRHPLVLPNGKVLYASAVDSLEFWLDRGLYAGGNCASPQSEISYTKCVAGDIFSALSKQILLSPNPGGKDALICETRAISRQGDSHVPVMLYEHMYRVHNLPRGVSAANLADAAVLNAMKNAVLYGNDRIFLARGTKESSGFESRTLRAGDGTVVEYVDESGYRVKEKVSIASLETNTTRTFFVPEEPVRWKYTDNVTYRLSKDGRLEKAPVNFNIVDFKEAYPANVAGIEYRGIGIQVEGTEIVIEREVLSRNRSTLNDRLREMFPEPTPENDTLIEETSRLVDSGALVLVGAERFDLERQKDDQTTLALIDQISELPLATDRYLSRVYAITERIGLHLWERLTSLLRDAAVRKVLVGIPRGGIPMLSRLNRFFRLRNLDIEARTVDLDRHILDRKRLEKGDTVFICDQVINTGKTIGATVEHLVEQNDGDLRFVLVTVAADPRAVLRLKRKYPQIARIFVGDLRKRVENRNGVEAALGHPGERSFPGEDFFASLLRKGSVIRLGNRDYRVEVPIRFISHLRSTHLVSYRTGKSYRLKIMVSKREGQITESVSALAREEAFEGGIPRNVRYFPEQGMLISDFVSNRSVSRELETLLKEHRDLDAFVNALWKDLLKVLLFLREQDHLHVDLRPVNVLFDEERGQWVVTSFTHEQYGRGPVSEVEAVRQAGVLLEDIVRAARSAGRPVSPDLPEIVERIDRGRIATLESLDLAMRRLFSRIARDDAPFEKAA